eukprot:5995021-Pleurochrysis_carterae.AAC.3
MRSHFRTDTQTYPGSHGHSRLYLDTRPPGCKIVYVQVWFRASARIGTLALVYVQSCMVTYSLMPKLCDASVHTRPHARRPSHMCAERPAPKGVLTLHMHAGKPRAVPHSRASRLMRLPARTFSHARVSTHAPCLA